MILSTFALSGTAVLAEGETAATPKLTVTASQSGNTASAVVALSGNPGVAGIDFKLSYDTDKLAPKFFEIGNGFSGATTNLNDTITSSPVTFAWSNATDVTTDGTLIKVMFDVKTSGEASFGITGAELAKADKTTVTATAEGTSLNLTGGETPAYTEPTIVKPNAVENNNTYAENANQILTTQANDADWQFAVDGVNGKRFSLLDINPNGGSSKYFILAANSYGDTRFYGADGTVKYYTKAGAHFNADDKKSVANALNYEHIGKENPSGNDYLKASTIQTLDKKIVKYIDVNHLWKTEPDRFYQTGSTASGCYETTCGVALLSYSELLKYKDKIGYGIMGNNSTDFGTAGTMWKLRTTADYASQSVVGLGVAMTSKDNKEGYVGKVGNGGYNFWIRPCFWLNNDFFKNVKLNLTHTGAEVKKALKNNYTYEDLKGIYSADELTQIGLAPTSEYKPSEGYTNVFDMSSNDISSLTDFVTLTQNKVTYDNTAKKLSFDAAKDSTNIYESAYAKFNMPSASNYDISFKVKFTDAINKTDAKGNAAPYNGRYGNLKVTLREGGMPADAADGAVSGYLFNMSATEKYVGTTYDRVKYNGFYEKPLTVYESSKSFEGNKDYAVAVKVYDLPNMNNQVKIEAYLDGKLYSEYTMSDTQAKKEYGNLLLTSTDSKFEITGLKINVAPRDMFDAEFSEVTNDDTRILKIDPKFLYTFNSGREDVNIPDNTKAFAALYGSDGKLKEIKVSAPTENSIEITETLTTSENIEFENISAGDKARVFFWDSNTLKPLTDKAFEYTVKQ